MSKKSLLMAVMMMVVGTPGRLMAQGRELTMSLDGLFRTAEEHNTSIKSFQSAIREAEAGISIADASLGIDWQVHLEEAILSEKDMHHPLLCDAPIDFVYNEREGGSV